MTEFEKIVNAARGAVSWQVNLVLTPPEIDVLLFEIDRMRVIEKAFKQKVKEMMEQEKEASLNDHRNHGV